MKKEGDRKPIRHAGGYGTGEISLKKLIIYNLVFFIPIIILLILSRFIGGKIARTLETTPSIASSMTLLVFTLLFFFIIIPTIRSRENVSGVRYALIGFLIVAIGLTIPAMIIGNFSPFLLELPHIASYILLTFIYCPEVLGMDIDISKWFKHYKQLFIVFIYTGIVLGYVFGFGYMYYLMDATNPDSFNYGVEKEQNYGTFVYYSTISFTTIGYGDITPVSSAARILICIEALLGAIVNVIFIAILFVYISNFQAFLREIQKEEREIKSIEGQLKKKKA